MWSHKKSHPLTYDVKTKSKTIFPVWKSNISIKLNVMLHSYVEGENIYKPTKLTRCVQYVHWVTMTMTMMHKCIMVKVRGENTQKVCKKLGNFPKTGGKFVKVGGEIIIFAKGRNVPKQGKQGGHLWSMTKKSHQKFWRMKKIGKIFGER